MAEQTKIDYLTIKGFKSIKRLERFPLGNLNVLIGSNGAGKSNLLSFFQMLREMAAFRFRFWVRKQGGADRILSFGVKETAASESVIELGDLQYRFRLEGAVVGDIFFSDESFHLKREDLSFVYNDQPGGTNESSLAALASKRFQLQPEIDDEVPDSADPREFSGAIELIVEAFRDTMAGIRVFHFHDTTDTAGVKRPGAVHDNEYLRPDASNLAAFLLALQTRTPEAYQQIRETIQLAIPFFDDFDLRPQPIDGGEEQVTLLWKQQDSDYPFWPSQLSDGSIRFICLATALLQPDPPSTIIIDEPELGLHPHAIRLLGGLIRAATKRMQVIVATQSIPLVNEFSVDDLIVVERKDGASVFRRHSEADFKQWLEEYSVGELWDKNLLGGRLPE